MGAQPSRTQSSGWGFVLVTAGAALWGTGGLAAMIVGTESRMSYPAISGLRLLGGGLIMFVVTIATGELRRVPRTRSAAGHILVTGFLTAILGGTYFQALPYIGVALATVLSIGSAPVFAAVATAVIDRAPPGRAVLAALAAALAGLALVVDLNGTAGQPGAAGQTLIGVGYALASGAAFAATAVVNRRVIPGLAARSLIATSFTVAGLVSTAWGALFGLHLNTMTSHTWLALLYLAGFHTVLGYLAFYAGLHRGVPATTAAILTLLEPVTATVLAVTILHEPLGGRAIVGIALILLAVVLVRPETAGEAMAAPEEPVAPEPREPE